MIKKQNVHKILLFCSFKVVKDKISLCIPLLSAVFTSSIYNFCKKDFTHLKAILNYMKEERRGAGRAVDKTCSLYYDISWDKNLR